MFTVCVLLGGCGMYDGSEPHETVLMVAALARRRARPFFAAPDTPQLHVVNHLDGDEVEGRRSVLAEAARLTRGRIATVGDLDPAPADALVIPGGYGVAKNLMTGFAEPGARPGVLPEVEGLVSHFLSARKPIGVISLGKLLLESVAAPVFTERLREEAPDQVYLDEERRLLYTPGYLVADRIEQIIPGIEALAERLIAWCEETPE